MTRYEIVRLAREAGIVADEHAGLYLPPEYLERFAVMVAAAEREACAKLCADKARTVGYDIKKLAREADAYADSVLPGMPRPLGAHWSDIRDQRFAALVAAAEREACAKAAERCLADPAARNMARTIRERGAA